MISRSLAWLNSNSGALTVVFSAIVTISTVIYAILTKMLVSETIKMRKAQTEPVLEVVLAPLEVAINLVRLQIKNIGLGTAIDLKFNFIITRDTGAAHLILDNFSSTKWLVDGLKQLGPGRERYTGYTVMFEHGDMKAQTAFELSIEYKNVNGQMFTQVFDIDMGELIGTYQLGEPPEVTSAKALKELQNDFSRITSGSRPIQVVMQHKEDLKLEQIRDYQAYLARKKELESSRASVDA